MWYCFLLEHVYTSGIALYTFSDSTTSSLKLAVQSMQFVIRKMSIYNY